MIVKGVRVIVWFVLLGVCGMGVSLIFGIGYGISFILGYTAFGVIMSGSFLHIRRQLIATQREHTQQNLESKNDKDVAQEQKTSFTSRFVVGTKLSFSLMRIVGYMLLLAGIGGLLYYDMLMPTTLFAGISLAVVYVVGIGVYTLQSAKTS